MGYMGWTEKAALLGYWKPLQVKLYDSEKPYPLINQTKRGGWDQVKHWLVRMSALCQKICLAGFFYCCFSLLSCLGLFLLVFYCCWFDFFGFGLAFFFSSGKSLRKSGFRATSDHQDSELMLEKAKHWLHFLWGLQESNSSVLPVAEL